MFIKTDIENVVCELSKYIILLLEDDPYIFLREADLTGHLWVKLIQLKDSFPNVSVKDRGITSPLHLEYPRLFLNDNDELEKNWNRRYDIVILMENDEEKYNKGYFDYKKVGVAFEVKWFWNGTPASVIKKINSDISVFNSEGNQDVPEFGISFNVNVKKKKESFHDVNKEISKIIPDSTYKWAQSMVVYIESYDPNIVDLRPPQCNFRWLN